MLKNRWFALVVLISLSGCTKYSEIQESTLEESQPPQPTAAGIKECPYGHHALKDVPLIVGLLNMTPELERQIANVEVWPAGCTPLGNYKTKVVCMIASQAITRFFGQLPPTISPQIIPSKIVAVSGIEFRLT